MIKNFIKKNPNIEIIQEVNLKKYNTYRLNVIAKYLAFPNNKEELKDLLKFLKTNNIKHIVLGNGSNTIFKNNYYNGVVILLNKLNKIKIENEIITVEAGYSLPKLSLETAKLNLKGLEFSTGIPGLIGASIAMNAGAYKNSLSEVVESVLVINDKFEFITLKNNELNFKYRSSLLKEKKDYYIVSAKLKLQLGDKNELLNKINNRRMKRIATQPLDMPSAGSVFRNPPNMYAGELIEKSGLKGYFINDAMISEKHANFIVNKGNATGEDIIELINIIKKTIKEKYNVDLVVEQIIVD